MLKIIKIIVGTYFFIFPLLSQATCINVTSTSSLSAEIISAGYTATTWAGATRYTGGSLGLPSTISLSSNEGFMPAGTLLASSTASFITASSSKAFTENQILFRCALADAESLYEVFATQANINEYSGRYETSDIESAYHTYVKGVAIRLTNMKAGSYYSPYWQSRALSSEEYITDDTYIYIPASAFSDTYIEIFKTASTVYTGGNSTNSYLYAEPYAHGFSTLRGPGMNTTLTDGAPETSYTGGWPTYWAGQTSLYNQVTFVRGAMCLVKDYPSIVLLPRISTSSLNSGEASQTTFDISLSCEDGAVSSVSKSSSTSANVAMGFLVNQSTAVTAATTLGLTSTSGLTHLLDTNYGSLGVASGVGIRIYSESGNALNLLSSNTTTTGNAGGWYAYKDLTTSQDDSTDGVTTYTGNFTASLEAISGEKVSAGTVNAQLQVVVSFQ